MTVREIMVTTDFSDTDRGVVRSAVELAAQLGLSRITLFHAHAAPEMTDFGPAVPFGMGGEMKDAVEAKLAEWATALSTEAVRVESLTTEGPPAHAIIETSAKYDLLVMANRGRGGARRFLLGSTTDRVVRGASCDVWVARVDRDSRG
jgi:nucleotide-binding universal stress UspA family protein